MSRAGKLLIWLWFDVETNNRTTKINSILTNGMLWFDVETNNRTTKFFNSIE